MNEDEIRTLDFTRAAWESLYDAVDNTQFYDKDALLIYNSLRTRMKLRSFGDYLKRYIYQNAGIKLPFREVPLKTYQLVIRDAFSCNHTPVSFGPTTSKLSALSKNWLTQQTVKRNVVLLLGFGLNMAAEDVNLFLNKALREEGLNPKDPFEVLCWYCYKNELQYPEFEQLWSRYRDMPANLANIRTISGESTVRLRDTMCGIRSESDLMMYLSKLKTSKSMSAISVTSGAYFHALYDEARELVARLYNAYEEERYRRAVWEYREKLSYNSRMSDAEKQERINRLGLRRKVFRREDITESDIEQVICAAIPKDRYGNLTPGKASKLNEQFLGKRFSRQRISDILSGNAKVTRFDLITLNFFVYSQKLDLYPNPKTRYYSFLHSMNEILEKCFLGTMYIQNPYECFILMCILSEDPLGTYADVWELSYH